MLFSLEFGAPAAAEAGDHAASSGADAASGGDDAEAARDDLARAQAAFDEVGAHFELPEGARTFAKELVLGVAQHRAQLDALIGEHAKNWRVERMASVDRNVLRLGTFELAHGDTPAPVVIDQAVELARRFGGDRSPAFVNGVLDAVAAMVRPPASRAARWPMVSIPRAMPETTVTPARARPRASRSAWRLP